MHISQYILYRVTAWSKAELDNKVMQLSLGKVDVINFYKRNNVVFPLQWT